MDRNRFLATLPNAAHTPIWRFTRLLFSPSVIVATLVVVGAAPVGLWHLRAALPVDGGKTALGVVPMLETPPSLGGKRLNDAERAETVRRLSAEFGGANPRHEDLPKLERAFGLKTLWLAMLLRA